MVPPFLTLFCLLALLLLAEDVFPQSPPTPPFFCHRPQKEPSSSVLIPAVFYIAGEKKQCLCLFIGTSSRTFHVPSCPSNDILGAPGPKLHAFVLKAEEDPFGVDLSCPLGDELPDSAR